MRQVAVFSRGLLKKKELKVLLGVDSFVFNPSRNAEVDFVVGWGRKENTQKAIKYAEENDVEYFVLEDGFIHSSGQGVLGFKSCSLIADPIGIYYDATTPSSLEKLLEKDSKFDFSNELLIRVTKVIKKITDSHITKYNNGSIVSEQNLLFKKKTVLVADQTAGDLSLKYGYATPQTFRDMLQTAIAENPDSQILLKVHPDVVAGKKKGNYDLGELSENIIVVSDQINPLILLKHVDVVYVATSQIGFEALMLGKKVICFGVPFYAGWGITDDRADAKLDVWKRRRGNRALEEIFASAYIQYSRYIHPITQVPCELEEVIEYFEYQYNKRVINLPKKVLGINFTPWKKSYIRSFFPQSHRLIFNDSKTSVFNKDFIYDAQLISWASKDQTKVRKFVNSLEKAQKVGGASTSLSRIATLNNKMSVWYVEDGFIRSTGLGSDLTAPASIVLDKTGIYYDPTQASDLEALLNTQTLSDEQLSRAEALKNSLIENELSKYNVGGEFKISSISTSKKQKIILIPGQVEDDASIQKGCVDVNTNTSLIQAVKQSNPKAFLIYKPHPDVVSGNRKGKVDKEVTDKNCDLVLLDASITDCLGAVDEVHTMTSLVGFEALMRELKVVCYGIPFYSGWGLTEDRHSIERRTKRLALNELIHATLIDYPLYMDWETETLTIPEVIVAQLKQTIDQQGGKQSNQIFWLNRTIRKVKNFLQGVMR